MAEPKSGFYEWMSKFTRPSETITDKQVDILIDAPGVRFPSQMRERMKYYIKKNWPTRPGKKSAFELFKEAGHPCTYEFFTKLIKGIQNDEGGVPSFEQNMQEKMKILSELDPVTDKETISDIKKSFEIQYEELSKFFTEGYSLHLQNNLLMRNGNPIAVREGDDRKRMEQCHAKLTEDDYERTSKRVGPDEEALGVAAKVLEGYGRTRRHRRKGKKTRGRKRRSRR
jgi:hypothetical protein